MSDAPFSFTVQHQQGRARAGELVTPHGRVATPVFMPVATQATVKALTPEEVLAAGAQMVLCNAYHLYLRPGVEMVARLGGLQQFMAWPRPILTDSGGFQAFSLGALRQVDEAGIRFRSHLDGSLHHFTPELATANQERLGADIIMCFDQCIGYGASKEEVRQAMERTHRWAQGCYDSHAASATAEQQALFGIVQGGTFPDLRAESAAAITSTPFSGYAIGGLAVGEDKAVMYEITQQVADLLPANRPRYLMGVGSPEDLVEGVAQGVDMFDCVLPTRVARNGALFTRRGRVDITARRFAEVTGPIEEGCDCYTCARFTTAYLWHLFRAKELLALRLASIHNLRFILRLMAEMRQAIVADRFEEFRRGFHDAYRPTDEAVRQAQKEKWLKARGG
ncbi:MAG: tRNA guanosine(34) transglycosylase Tgt [Dehalococcoidia bacterium]|nr:tRNA guanosine(34) transglycosylase Tgt [Dehalococcoidia bacterium]MSQ17348.1 tRNA guanosine(34) transglycosylase Tgt [Dehalococcoidia bacterium]